MKPMRYYGKNPGEFIRKHTTCDVSYCFEDVSVNLLSVVMVIRNKRKRMRFVKKLNRIGITSFARQYIEITNP